MDTELETRAFIKEELPKQTSTLVSLIAGSIGGAAQVIVRLRVLHVKQPCMRHLTLQSVRLDNPCEQIDGPIWNSLWR